jgi:hypothetical protein
MRFQHNARDRRGLPVQVDERRLWTRLRLYIRRFAWLLLWFCLHIFNIYESLSMKKVNKKSSGCLVVASELSKRCAHTCSSGSPCIARAPCRNPYDFCGPSTYMYLDSVGASILRLSTVNIVFVRKIDIYMPRSATINKPDA